MEIKVLIANCENGNLHEWVTLPISEIELRGILSEIKVAYNEDEDVMDLEGTGFYIGEVIHTDFEFINRDYTLTELNEIAEKLEVWEKEETKFLAVQDIWGIEYPLETKPDNFIFLKGVTTEKQVGEYYLNGLYGIPDFRAYGRLSYYITVDTEMLGHDVVIDCDGGLTEYGFIEYIG